MVSATIYSAPWTGVEKMDGLSIYCRKVITIVALVLTSKAYGEKMPRVTMQLHLVGLHFGSHSLSPHPSVSLLVMWAILPGFLPIFKCGGVFGCDSSFEAVGNRRLDYHLHTDTTACFDLFHCIHPRTKLVRITFGGGGEWWSREYESLVQKDQHLPKSVS